MAQGYLAVLNLLAIMEQDDDLAEMDAIEEQRICRRVLRDMANPFECPERSFRSFFRVSRELALDLCGWLRPTLERERAHGLKVEQQVLTALRFFSTGCYQAAVGQDSHLYVSQTTVSRSINTVARAISTTLLREVVTFPSTEDERRRAKRKFEHCPQPFLHTIGAIDCTHIAIIAPRDHEEDYVNHHGYHSINVQAVCDPSFKILQICARYGGRAHDSYIWSVSPLRRHLQELYFEGMENTWLIGDSGYPSEPWLLTPIVDAEEGTPDFLYTTAHCKARSIIERCFGIWKASLGCLSKKRILYYDPVTAGHIIYACAVLHNLRLHYKLLEEEDLEPDDIAVEEDPNVGIGAEEGMNGEIVGEEDVNDGHDGEEDMNGEIVGEEDVNDGHDGEEGVNEANDEEANGGRHHLLEVALNRRRAFIQRVFA